MIWYRVGSADESEGWTGTAHFLEHLMFKGTDRYRKGEIDRKTQLLGGSNNAMTGRDFTSYYFNLPSAAWEESLAIEADRMKHCKFDRDEVELERQTMAMSPLGSMQGKEALEWNVTGARNLPEDLAEKGGEIRIEDFRGRWLVVEFWGFW